MAKENEVKARWRKHFVKVPEVIAEVEETDEKMKSSRTPGTDSITADLLKADTDTTVNVLYELFNTIWEKESVPEHWSIGLIVKLPKKGNLTSC